MPEKITLQFEKGSINFEGHIDHLTQEESRTLQQFWKFFLDNSDKPYDDVESDPVSIVDTTEGAGKGYNNGEPIIIYHDCAYGQTVQDVTPYKIIPVPFKSLMKDGTFREALWMVIREDMPDTLVLRFLRARKWDLKRSLNMAVAAIKWRQREHVEEVIWSGEVANEATLMYKGVSYAHGFDKLGHPILWSPSFRHHQKDQSFDQMKRYLIWMMETARQLLCPPIEKVCLIMDLSNHSNSNMDWPFVKMFLKYLEAYYPECLAIAIIYNGPWWFSGVYKLITPLLDPVVAAKVQFAKNPEGILRFVDKDQLIASKGGRDQFEYEYELPTADENAKMADLEGKEVAAEAWRKLIDEFEGLTRQWIAAGEKDDKIAEKKIEARRTECQERIVAASLKLDKFTRARHIYHRQKVLIDKKLDFSPIQIYDDTKDETDKDKNSTPDGVTDGVTNGAAKDNSN